MARLALFSFFCLVLEVRPQNLPRPELSVFPVVAQDGSVKLGCMAPYERVDQCSFYPEGDKTNLKTSQTCQLSLTVSELMRWTGRGYSSPEQINIICFYIGGESSYSVTSPDSQPAPVTIIDAPRLSVSPAGRSPIQLSCTPPYSAGVSRCYFYTEGRERYVKTPSCQISLSPSELTTWANHSYSSPEPISVMCYYAVRVSHREFLSPHSLPAPVRALELPLLPPPSTTTQWTTPKLITAPVRGRARSLFTSLLVTVPSVRVDYDERRREFSLVCEISLYESLGADVGCNFYIGDETLVWMKSQRTSSRWLACRFLMHETDLISRLQSAKSREMACDFSLSSDPTVRSPPSDTYSPTAASSTVSTLPSETTTASLITHSRPDHRIQTPSRRMTLVLMVSASCVTILLAGVMFICLCSFIRTRTTGSLRKFEECPTEGADPTFNTTVVYSLSNQEQLSELREISPE